ncbi:MAG: NAD(P)/FAD-dependent oxidoreductase [Desulfobacterales bacterium]|nr:MAG: NAD(P)/FAD-dependent oxidoreductase [Desulfobacterales bacterium]
MSIVARARKHTIIGNSAAGLSAIKAIRKSGDSRPIVLISAEKCPAYSPVLTTYYIGNQVQRSKLFLVDERFYSKHGVATIFGRSVEAVDPGHRQIHLDDGSRLDYDNLLIASGASARTLDNVTPAASKYVSTLRTIADADKIKAVSESAEKVVVTGAGLVSLQTIKAILTSKIGITLISGSEQVLSQQMDRESALIIQAKLAAQGIDILFGRDVSQVYEKGGRAQVVTSYGETLPADLVVVGKGVQPNVQMVRHTSIKANLGILVDERMRTSVEDVYAAGDAAEGNNEITGETEVIATWFNACAQGEIAGLNMAGRPARRLGQFRENVTTLMDVVVASMGASKPDYGQYQELRHVDLKQGASRKLYLAGSRIVGALLVGNAHDAGVIRHCIANKIDISPWKDRIAAAPLDFGKILGGQNPNWPSLGN